MCFDPETDILTRSGWRPVADITYKDEVATLNTETDELEWQYPTYVWAYDHVGKMYYLATKQLDMLVTLDHRLWVARPGKEYQAVKACDFYKSKGEWQFKKDCNWRGVDRKAIAFESYTPRNSRENCLTSASMDDWLEFLGYYIAEGWSIYQEHKNHKYVRIAQYPGDICDKIEAVIKRLGLRYSYDEKDKRFVINSKWLYSVLEPLGNSRSKYVPAYIQELCPRQLQIFLDAYLDGDGHRGACYEYTTSSKRLAYDIQLICLKLGFTASVKKVERVDNWQKVPCYRARINRTQLRPRWKKSRAKQYASVQEKLVDYEGKVHCITVANHVIYCKRRDKTYWSHNSGRYG